MASNIKDHSLHVFNPGTNESAGSVDFTSDEQIEKILGLSGHDRSWSELSILKRVRNLKRFRKNITKNLDTIVDTIISETGKKPVEALTEIFVCLESIKTLSSIAPETLMDQSRGTGVLTFLKKARVVFEPMGSAAIISPWNYPLILPLCASIEALIAGNNVVLKPSEQTPLTSVLLKKIWDQSLPEYINTFQIVLGLGDVAEKIIASPNINVVCFTGSTNIGRKVAVQCANLLKPAILEMGGVDPMVVMDDANLERAAKAIVWGSFTNAGQACISTERVYIQESIFEDVVSLLKKELSKLSSGPDSRSQIGAVCTSVNLEKIKHHIKNSGSKEIIEGDCKEGSGMFVAPTILIEPDPNSAVNTEETFGPVVCLYKFEDDAAAVSMANSGNYNLSASVFGKNKKRINYFVKSLSAGSISVNDVQTQVGIASIPFGGTGKSGLGRRHGKEGLLAYTNHKSVLENVFSLKWEFWWYDLQRTYYRIAKKIIPWIY